MGAALVQLLVQGVVALGVLTVLAIAPPLPEEDQWTSPCPSRR
jgi:hypothetical protein